MGAIQEVGNFLGIKKFADAMATTGRVLTGQVKQDRQVQAQADIATQKLSYALRNEKDSAKKQQLGRLIQSQLDAGNVSSSEIDPGLNLNAKEIYGSAANVGLNVAMPGAFKGGKAAIIGKNALLGAGFGAASGLEKNRSAGGVVGSTVGGAVVGAGIGVIGLFAKAAKDFIGGKIPEWMMNKAVKPALQDLKKNVKYGSDTLGKQLLDEGVKGGPKKLLQIADDKTNQLENSLQLILESADDAFEKELFNQRMQRKALPSPSFIPLGAKSEPVGSVMQILRPDVGVGRITRGEAMAGQFIKGRPLKAGQFKPVYQSTGKVVREVIDKGKAFVRKAIDKNVNTYQENIGLIKRDKVLSYIKEFVKQKAGTPGMSGDVQRIKNIVDDIPEMMTLSEANTMKRRIYTELRDIAYKLDAKLGVKAATLKQIARGLKTEIENTVGGTVVKDINQKLSIYGRLENSMVDQLAREMRNNGIGLTDAILLAGGDTTSILALLRHIGKGTETYMAQGLKGVGNILNSSAVQGIKKQVIRRGGFNLP